MCRQGWWRLRLRVVPCALPVVVAHYAPVLPPSAASMWRDASSYACRSCEVQEAEAERTGADYSAACASLLPLSTHTPTQTTPRCSCEMEKAEAERMEADYSAAYAEFSVKHAQNAPLVEALKRVSVTSPWGVWVWVGGCLSTHPCSTHAHKKPYD